MGPFNGSDNVGSHERVKYIFYIGLLLMRRIHSYLQASFLSHREQVSFQGYSRQYAPGPYKNLVAVTFFEKDLGLVELIGRKGKAQLRNHRKFT